MSRAAKIFLWFGVILIIIIGFIHAFDSPDSFKEAAYKGWLFYANALGSLVAAYGIIRNKRWGWNLGLFIAAVSFICYVISRTLGLPLIPAEPDAWLEPLGVAALITEGSYIAVFILRKIGGNVSKLYCKDRL